MTGNDNITVPEATDKVRSLVVCWDDGRLMTLGLTGKITELRRDDLEDSRQCGDG